MTPVWVIYFRLQILFFGNLGGDWIRAVLRTSFNLGVSRRSCASFQVLLIVCIRLVSQVFSLAEIVQTVIQS